jgi:hypothetical protein
MRNLTTDNNTRIRWNFTTKLDDLDYADDIALLSSTKEQLQKKFNHLNRYAHSTGLKNQSNETECQQQPANRVSKKL